MSDITREQILAMEAGRELDALVNQIVFERTNDKHRAGWFIDGQLSRPIPYYSKDISAAWEAVEELRNKGIYLDLRTFADFYEVIHEKKYVHDIHLPVAICRMSLLAVMNL